MAKKAVAIGRLAIPIGDPNRDQSAHLFRPPNSDIDEYISFSVLRCVLSIVGFLLVLSDIPRTGLYLSLSDFYPAAGVDSVMFWGPYAYPVVHINVSADRASDGQLYMGWDGSSALDKIATWGYKYDSMSIAPRGIAEHLNISTFPRCLFYDSECDIMMKLEVVFSMLDELISTIRIRYFADPHEFRPFVFWTRNVWLDRLYSVIVQLFWRREDIRLNTIHYYGPHRVSQKHGVQICRQRSLGPSSKRRAAWPLICDNPTPWSCKNPTKPGDTGLVPLWDHIDLRLIMLLERYPELELDLTLFSTRFRLSSKYEAGIPTVSHQSDTLEITTLIRGRRCEQPNATNGGECETVFIDDYRYERAVMESDEKQWTKVTQLLRLVCQLFIWIRIVLLWFGCYLARRREPKHVGHSCWLVFRNTWSAFFKIPSHVIIYGNWLPICGYALAHVIDSAIVHIAGEFFWSSVNGLFQFSFVRFILLASMQMRNIWFVALIWKASMLVHARAFPARQHQWSVEDGIVGLRGMLITLTSWLTIFSYLRSLQFRNSDVLEFHELPRHTPFTSYHVRHLHMDITPYGYRLDTKVVAGSVLVVCGLLLFQQTVFRILSRRPSNVFICRSLYVPESGGFLWPREVLNIFWYVRWRKSRTRTTSSSNRTRIGPAEWLASRISAVTAVSPFDPHQRHLPMMVTSHISQGACRAEPARKGTSPQSTCSVCSIESSIIMWRGVQGCTQHESLWRIHRRSRRLQSLVRLMNIAFLTDPMVLFGVVARGRPLYLYRFNIRQTRPGPSTIQPCHSDCPEALILLPRCLDIDHDVSIGYALGTTHHPPRFELIGTINSTTVPWDVLVDIG